MATTATQDRTTATNGAVDKSDAPRRNPADIPDDEIETPTFKAKVSKGKEGLGYAEIKITCQYRDADELHAWIIAASSRLVNDIKARGTSVDG